MSVFCLRSDAIVSGVAYHFGEVILENVIKDMVSLCCYFSSDTTALGASGFREKAIVFPREIKFNSNPPNPDNPAHFTCGPAK